MYCNHGNDFTQLLNFTQFCQRKFAPFNKAGLGCFSKH